MKEQLNKILLVDDSEADNFVHKRVIKKCNVTKSIVAKLSAESALDYLTTLEEDKYPNPDLIFLDINMPGMNGWEFLEEYAKLDEQFKAGIVVTMLTTSSSPDDRARAQKNGIIDHFENKPLTPEVLMKVLEKHFPERF